MSGDERSQATQETIQDLRVQLERLKDHCKLLGKTENKLFASQREVARQLHRIEVLNDFTLGAAQATSEREVIEAAITVVAASMRVTGAVAFLRNEVLTCGADGKMNLERDPDVTVPAPAEVTIVENHPLVDWLEGRHPGIGGRPQPTYRRSLLLLPLAGGAVLVVRTEALTLYERVAEDADRAFVDLVVRHVETALGAVRERNELERSVAKTAQELAVANAELEGRLMELRDAQAGLVRASRRAGMADVATSVLHNVGNVLNSVNVATNIVTTLARRTKVAGLRKVAERLATESVDPKLATYLSSFADVVESERAEMVTELEELTRNVDHIKVVISMQQAHAKSAGVIECLSLASLCDDAIRASTAGRGSLNIVRDYAKLPDVHVDRHKVFEILMNLLANAADAVEGVARDHRITVSLRTAEDDRVAILVTDNGVGIAPTLKDKIFGQGFTTKPKGHGFGLHSCACAARELGGGLSVESEGEGRGASFRLVFPAAAPSPPPVGQYAHSVVHQL